MSGDCAEESTAKGEWNAREGPATGERDAAERERVCLETARRTEDMTARVRVESTDGEGGGGGWEEEDCGVEEDGADVRGVFGERVRES